MWNNSIIISEMAVILTNKSATAIPRSILYVTCFIDIESVTIFIVLRIIPKTDMKSKLIVVTFRFVV